MDDKLSRAILRVNESYKKIKQEREAKSIKVIDFNDIPKRSMAPTTTHSGAQATTCQATTLSGRPCKFKATCGKFCKKHMI